MYIYLQYSEYTYSIYIIHIYTHTDSHLCTCILLLTVYRNTCSVQSVCLKVFRCYLTGGAAPPLVRPPPPPPLCPPPPLSPSPATPLPHSLLLLLLTPPGEPVVHLAVAPGTVDVCCAWRWVCVFVFSQYPCLWTVGCGELSPSHSPCPALHGPISGESLMQPPSHGRLGGAGWPPGPTHSFWAVIGWISLHADHWQLQLLAARLYHQLSVHTSSLSWWLLVNVCTYWYLLVAPSRYWRLLLCTGTLTICGCHYLLIVTSFYWGLHILVATGFYMHILVLVVTSIYWWLGVDTGGLILVSTDGSWQQSQWLLFPAAICWCCVKLYY